MENGLLIRKLEEEVTQDIYQKLNKDEFEEIEYVSVVINDLLSNLTTNDRVIELSEQYGGYEFIIKQIEKNEEVEDFNDLFRILFRTHQQQTKCYEEDNIQFSTILLLSSMTTLNEIINRLYEDDFTF